MMIRLDAEAPTAIAHALEEAPVAYCVGLTASSMHERLRAVDALTGWIGAKLAPPVQDDGQLTLPMGTDGAS
jgi:hypothetical protein